MRRKMRTACRRTTAEHGAACCVERAHGTAPQQCEQRLQLGLCGTAGVVAMPPKAAPVSRTPHERGRQRCSCLSCLEGTRCSSCTCCCCSSSSSSLTCVCVPADMHCSSCLHWLQQLQGSRRSHAICTRVVYVLVVAPSTGAEQVASSGAGVWRARWGCTPTPGSRRRTCGGTRCRLQLGRGLVVWSLMPCCWQTGGWALLWSLVLEGAGAVAV
jgi:hypothetical protein